MDKKDVFLSAIHQQVRRVLGGTAQVSKRDLFFSLEGRHRRLVHNLQAIKSGAGASYQAPPAKPPAEHLSAFTMDGRVPILDWYLNDKPDPKSIQSVVMYSTPLLTKARADLRQRKYKSYGVTNDYLQKALAKYPISGKCVLIIGSTYPQFEAFCLNAGGFPVTIEYNVRFSDSAEVTFFSPQQFAELSVKGDASICISSFEHDGLGRYGDPIDPDGDLKAMKQMLTQIEPGGLMFFSVPFGRDAIAWNAHRIYGPLRLPRLLEGWEVVELFGDERVSKAARISNGSLQIDQSGWEEAFAPARNGVEWVTVLRVPVNRAAPEANSHA